MGDDDSEDEQPPASPDAVNLEEQAESASVSAADSQSSHPTGTVNPGSSNVSKASDASAFNPQQVPLQTPTQANC